mgnify:CR=1 FL=1
MKLRIKSAQLTEMDSTGGMGNIKSSPPGTTGSDAANKKEFLRKLNFVLVNAVTQYDIKQSSKRGYNSYALSHYLGACTDIIEALQKERDWYAAKHLDRIVADHFTGPLLTVVTRAISRMH